jgi:flagellar basal-body rod modification protein FlgD
MTATNTIATGLAASGAATQTPKTASTLGINDFLKLMSTQLTNQDPLKPLDSTAFVAQLAQFGTVSGIQSMQGSLQTLADSLRASQALSGATLVGHQILAPGSTGTYTSGTAFTGAVQVPSGASAVGVNIYDAGGQLVRRLALPATAGLQAFSWDGLGDNGAQAVSGNYGFRAIADIGGSSVSLQPQLSGTVGSVSIGSDGTSLTLNTRELGAVALGSVTQVM